MKKDDSLRCYHCGDLCDPDHTYTEVIEGVERHFCCSGCLGACLIIYEAGEGSYYKKRNAPASGLFKGFEKQSGSLDDAFDAPESTSSINQTYDIPSIMEEYVEPAGEGILRIRMAIEGIHCSSCVYLNERILSRTKGIREAVVNYETGRATILFDPETIAISKIIQTVQSIGYNAVPLRPGQKSDAMSQEGKHLLWRMTVAGFLAGNIMLIAAALWFGFFDRSMTPGFKRFFHWVEFALATPAFFYAGSVFHRGWRSFLKTGLAGMDLLISIGISVAYFYSSYLTLADKGEVYFDSVATIIFLLLVGRYVEWIAKYKQRVRMEDLVRPLPAHCNRVLADGREEVIAARELRKGDTVRAAGGEVLPTDGILLEGECTVDESVLTGESIPVVRRAGDRLLAGSRVVSREASYRVESLPHESSLSVLSRLADMSGMEKSRIEQVAQKQIPFFSFAVIFIALATFLYWFFYAGADVRSALEATISVLIISCPCALALSVPTAIGSALYLGLTHGIMVRDGGVLEALNRSVRYFFDKTGTITRGRPAVVDHLIFQNGMPVEAESGMEVAAIFDRMRFMEQGSYHPVGRSLFEFARHRWQELTGEKGRSKQEFSGQKHELAGKGVFLEWEGGITVAGNLDMLQEYGIELHPSSNAFRNKHHDSIIVGLGTDGVLQALFALQDEPLESAAPIFDKLLSQGGSVSILTGDRKESALTVARSVGLSEESVHASLLPVDKEKFVNEAVKESGNRVCMVGDGYNDAVALSRASVAVVMAKGAPLSLEHAGVILLQNDLNGLLRAKSLAKRAMFTIRSNLAMSLLYNSIMIPIAASGHLLPVWCALFMSLSSLTVVGNSILLRLRGLPER